MRHRGNSSPAIPDDNAPVAPAHRPTGWTVRRVRSIAYVLFGLAVAASLMSVYLTYRYAQESSAQAKNSSAQAAAVDRRLSVLEQDLADRTRQRDAERDAATAQAEADREQFRVRFCEILGELSATFPNLVPVEQALHCALPPEASHPAAPPASLGPPASTGSPRSPSPPATARPPAPPSPTTAPPSAPPGSPAPLCGLLPSLC